MIILQIQAAECRPRETQRFGPVDQGVREFQHASISSNESIHLRFADKTRRSHFSHPEVVPADLAQNSSYGVITIEVGVAGTEYDPTEVSAPLLASRLND
jgi:hypothetical protein